jgi:hypothetical protein
MKMQRLHVEITQFSQKRLKLGVFGQKTKRRQDIMPRRLLNAKFLALVTSQLLIAILKSIFFGGIHISPLQVM